LELILGDFVKHQVLVFILAPCINSDEKSFIVPTDALNNIKPQLENSNWLKLVLAKYWTAP
jgi:hypothetical protein